MSVKILSGADIVGHLFRDEAEAIKKALPVLVHAYAKATGLDVHPAEATLVEVRGIGRDGRRASAITEVRIAGTTIASWRTLPGHGPTAREAPRGRGPVWSPSFGHRRRPR